MKLKVFLFPVTSFSFSVLFTYICLKISFYCYAFHLHNHINKKNRYESLKGKKHMAHLHLVGRASTIEERYEAAKQTIDANPDIKCLKWLFFRARILWWCKTGNM